MSDTSPSSAPPSNRCWLPRFGMRSVFVLIGLASLVAWWARNEVVKEQRREELVAEFSMNGNDISFDRKSVPPWNRKFAAWLRGKPPVLDISIANVNHVPPDSRFPEFVAAFRPEMFSVQINADQVTPEVLDALGNSPSLTIVNLRGPIELDDTALEKLSKIRAKLHFSVGVAKVDDDLLRSAERAGLHVNMYWDDFGDGSWQLVTDHGLQVAAKLPLKDIYAGRGASDKGFAAFRDHASAANIRLIGSQYTDASAEILGTFKNLWDLSLINTSLSDEAIAKAIANRKLYSFTMHDMPLGPQTIAALEKQGSLQKLELKNVPLSGEQMAVLATLPIYSLTLEGPYDDNAVAGLAPLATKLHWASFRVPQATDTGLDWLATTTSLSYLGLDDSQISATLLARFAPLSAGRSLGLGGPNINAAALRAIASVPGINSIHLYGASVDDEALAALQPPASRVSLHGTRVNARGLKALAGNGDKVAVTITYAKGTAPPVSESEAAEIDAATNGLVTVRFYAADLDQFEARLPQASRQILTETNAP
jgi:hypothetical protein